MFERYTVHAQQAMAVAQEQALLLGHDHVGTEHLLLGLLKESEGAAAKLLDLEGVSFESVRQKVEDNAGQSGSTSTGSPPLTPRAKKVLQLALRQALGSRQRPRRCRAHPAGPAPRGPRRRRRRLVGLGVDLNGLRAQVTGSVSGWPPPTGQKSPQRRPRATAKCAATARCLTSSGAT